MRLLKSCMFDVIVIGGGASGMMAAGVAASRGKNILLLEKNPVLGAKLAITGGGRCNITNAESNTRVLLRHYGAAERFLHSPFSQFGVADTFTFFASLGLPLVTKEGNRVFPQTERAPDVVAALERFLQKHHVVCRFDCPVRRIQIQNQQVGSIETPEGEFQARSVILATGGTSHPETGATGDGFRWLAECGHTVQQPTPTIVPLAVQERWIKQCSGVTLRDVKITFVPEGAKRFSKRGDILCTHFGISGPVILNSAGKLAGTLEAGSVRAQIDAYPDEDFVRLEKRILELFDANKNKALKTVFTLIAPRGTAEALQRVCTGMRFDTPVHSVSREDRRRIVHLMKALPVTVTHLMGLDRAVVADGGVVLSEVDVRTMRSKVIENLFITGDLLHITRPSGGYSLQLCWTTGFVAGSSV